MKFISFKQAIRNKIKTDGDTYQKNSAIINKWYKEQLNILSERSSQTIINFVNEVAEKINNDEEVNTNESSDVNIYKDDDFLITYNFDFNYANFYFLNPPDEVIAAHSKCLLTAPDNNNGVFDNLTYTVYEEGELLINIGINELFFGSDIPMSGTDSFYGSETEFYDDQL